MLRQRSGAYAIVFALLVMVLLGIGALAVDIGYKRVIDAQLTAVAEVSAHGGAAYLDGSDTGLDEARSTASLVASFNRAAATDVDLDLNEGNAPQGDIVLGLWDEDMGSFTPSEDPAEVNALQVRVEVDLETMLGLAAFGQTHMLSHGTAIATGPVFEGAGGVECYLPFAIPDCLLDTSTEDELQDLTIKLSPAGVDNAGWGRHMASPNANWIREQINDCQGDGEVNVGDPVGLQNGVVSSALSELVSAINGSDTSWDPMKHGSQPSQPSHSAVSSAAWGNIVEAPILLFDGGPEYCTGGGGSFNGFETISGFVWASVYDVRTSGGAKNKNVWMRLDLSEDRILGTEGGGLDAGILYEEPGRIVQ